MKKKDSITKANQQKRLYIFFILYNKFTVIQGEK